MLKTELLIIGGGAAGMAAALAAVQTGQTVLLVERDSRLGGVLPQCLHHGFGLSYFHQDLTGAEYARRFVEQINNSPVQVLLQTTALLVNQERTALLSNSQGLIEVAFQRLILATGCREIPLGALPIAGTRPAGIFTAGQAQQMLNLYGYDIGDDIIILGSGDIGLIMAQQLSQMGKRVPAIIEQQPQFTALPEHQYQCREVYHIPSITSATITEIHGRRRIEGVTIRHLDTLAEEFLACSTLLVAVGLRPERELIEPLQQNGAYPHWLTLAGNCEHVHKIFDTVSLQGEKAALSML